MALGKEAFVCGRRVNDGCVVLSPGELWAAFGLCLVAFLLETLG